MRLRQLRYFVAVVRHGSMTAAARVLHVAQPALGTQIRLLEEELGVALLERHARGVTPTEAGRRLFAHAVDILERVERARREVAATTDRRLSLGLTPSLVRLLGTVVLDLLERRAPRTRVHLHEAFSTVLARAVLAGVLDLALAYEVRADPLLWRRPLLEEEILLFCAPGVLPATDSLPLAEALRLPLVLPGPGDSVRLRLEALAAESGLPVRVVQEFDSIAALKAYVAAGHAVTFMPRGACLREIEAGTLVAVRVGPPRPSRRLFAVTPAGHRPPLPEEALDAFLADVTAALLASLGDLARPLGHEDAAGATTDLTR